MKKILFLLAMMATMALSVSAQEVQEAPEVEKAPQAHKVPAYRGLIERVQPNGYVLRTYLRGDERKHWAMTEDGWQIKEDKNGWLKYCKKDRKGNVVISSRKAKNVEDRTKCQKRWLKKHGIVIDR